MANDEYLSDVKGGGGGMQTRPYGMEDDLGMSGTRGNGSGNGATAARAGVTMNSEVAVGEVMGDAPAPPVKHLENVPEGAPAHAEVGTEGTESGEEFVEATAAQLAAAAAESGEETAVSDLREIEGYEPREAAAEGAAAEHPLIEAGAALAGPGQEEFLPFLAALAPTLISTAGPAVAKAVVKRLSPRAKRVISRLPRPPLPPAAGAAVSNVLGALKGGAGTGNLLALVAQLLRTAQQKPAGESGAEADETLVNEAVSTLEVIIGTDDRVRITNTTAIPWRRICALRITFPSGATYRGSGFLIGPRAVATAGHCVYLHDQGGWARRVEVIPGANGSARPFGQATSTTFRSVVGWVKDRKPASDYGCIVLPAGAFGGKNLGSFGFAAFDAQKLVAQPSVVAGYPGDKPFAEAWGMSRVIKTVTAQTLIYDIDTMGGQSGAPVYIKVGGERYAVGIHNYGNGSGNSATRITAPVLERLKAWRML